MLGWFKTIQEVTQDLPKVAKIILMQNPNSLKWAKDRLWEFAECLVHEFGLVPDRTANGLDWTGSYQSEEKDDLVFFDHYYGVTKDPYDLIPVSLRVGLQCYEGAHPISFVETRLSFEVEDPKNDMVLKCSGDIELIGQRGVWWTVQLSLSCRDKILRSEIEKHFNDFVEFDQDGHTGYGYRVSATEARDLFRLMATFFKKHN